MKRLPILALALIAVSCSRFDVEKPRIGLLTRAEGSVAGAAVRAAIESAALGKAELLLSEAGDRQADQDAQASALFEKKLRALALEPIDAGLVDPIIKQAKAERVPLVFFGLEPPRRSMRSWDKLFYVGTRREELGAAQGELLAAYWNADPAADRNKDGLLQFVALTAAEEGQASARQADAAAKALAAAGIRSVMLAQDIAEAGAARKRAEALLSVYGERIEAFICHDDEMALGAAEALKATGWAKGNKRVPVVGAGDGSGLPAAVAAAIESEALIGTVSQDAAAQGKAVFDLSHALARDTTPWRTGLKITDAKYIWVPCRIIAKGDLPPKPAD